MELCTIHNVPIPLELHNIAATFREMPAAVQRPASQKSNSSQNNHDQDIDTDPEDIEDVVGVESDQDSDAEEDLPLELDDGRNANKVQFD